jgi:hypothetical protein
MRKRSGGNCILDKSQLGSATCAFRGGLPDGAADEALLPWDSAFPELVSLWGMIKSNSLYAISFHIRLLHDCRNSLRMHTVSTASAEAVSQDISLLLTGLKYLANICEKSGLSDTADRINNASTQINFYQELKNIDGNTDQLLNNVIIQIDMICEVFVREAKKHQFIHIPQNKSAVLLAVKEKWSPIWERFPSVEEPSRAATEAYSVGLNEASIYHMMMVLEVGLKALARRLVVKYDRQVWDTIIEKIEEGLRGAIQSRGRTPKGSKPLTPAAAARLRGDITLFSEAAKEFVWFKEAWRNHVAHGRAKYDENDALKIMMHVHNFMGRLSARLKETRR